MAAPKFDYWLTAEGLALIEGWARDGLVLEEIAHNMGINRCTLYEWRREFPTIANALKNGRAVADRKVENALFNRAIGSDVTEVKVTEGKDGKSVVTTTKHVPADVTACIYWLKNRKPDEWNDRKTVTVEADFEALEPLADMLKN